MRRIHGEPAFNSQAILSNFNDLKFDKFIGKTLEISTRFHYDEVTGMYLSQHSIDIDNFDTDSYKMLIPEDIQSSQIMKQNLLYSGEESDPHKSTE